MALLLPSLKGNLSWCLILIFVNAKPTCYGPQLRQHLL
jgi:hypothetical protein